jgi:hypothetical protein
MENDTEESHLQETNRLTGGDSTRLADAKSNRGFRNPGLPLASINDAGI